MISFQSFANIILTNKGHPRISPISYFTSLKVIFASAIRGNGILVGLDVTVVASLYSEYRNSIGAHMQKGERYDADHLGMVTNIDLAPVVSR